MVLLESVPHSVSSSEECLDLCQESRKVTVQQAVQFKESPVLALRLSICFLKTPPPRPQADERLSTTHHSTGECSRAFWGHVSVLIDSTS